MEKKADSGATGSRDRQVSKIKREAGAPGGLKVTYQDILALGETNRRIELFDGECIMPAMPTSQHQYIATRLAFHIFNDVEKRGLGKTFGSPVDVYVSQTTVLQPDLSFLSTERLFIDDGKKLNGAPDLVVEILSEATEQRDRTFKFREYARSGAREYWLVSPEKKEIEVYQNSEKGFIIVNIFRSSDTLNSPLFGDIQLRVAKIFE
ncbi:MAG TPA: Uma2 family endonuclease [Bacteroidota bacterium]|nr:Uma2 family endonuclease [Bacteroidota bacterium]